MIAALGEIIFEVSSSRHLTFHDAQRSAEARWTEHEVFAGKPLSEFLGPGLATINLSVRLDITKGVVPIDELKRLRLAMDTGEVLQFTLGDANGGGELVGDFTIRAVSEGWRAITNRGVIAIAQAAIQLREYR
jgi:phage protein U